MRLLINFNKTHQAMCPLKLNPLRRNYRTPTAILPAYLTGSKMLRLRARLVMNYYQSTGPVFSTGRSKGHTMQREVGKIESKPFDLTDTRDPEFLAMHLPDGGWASPTNGTDLTHYILGKIPIPPKDRLDAGEVSEHRAYTMSITLHSGEDNPIPIWSGALKGVRGAIPRKSTVFNRWLRPVTWDSQHEEMVPDIVELPCHVMMKFVGEKVDATAGANKEGTVQGAKKYNGGVDARDFEPVIDVLAFAISEENIAKIMDNLRSHFAPPSVGGALPEEPSGAPALAPEVPALAPALAPEAPALAPEAPALAPEAPAPESPSEPSRSI